MCHYCTCDVKFASDAIKCVSLSVATYVCGVECGFCYGCSNLSSVMLSLRVHMQKVDRYVEPYVLNLKRRCERKCGTVTSVNSSFADSRVLLLLIML